MKTRVEQTPHWKRLSPGRVAVVATLFCVGAAPVVDALNAQPGSSTSAQTTAQRSQIPHPNNTSKIKYLLIGAGTGALLATAYYGFSDRGRTAASCGPLNCALPYLSFTGAFIGLFSAKDIAATRRAEAPRIGTTLEFNTLDVPVVAIPLGFAIRDTLIAVVTDSGAQMVSAGAKPLVLRRRGVGLSDLRQVALRSASPQLFIGTGFALWEGSATAGQLSRAYDGPIDALASDDNGVLGASGSTIFYRRGTGGTAVTDSLRADAAVTAATFDKVSGHFWVATDSSLSEIDASANGIKTGKKVPVPAKVLSIAVSQDWIAVAMGSDGVAAWRRDAMTTSIVTPVRIKDEPRFAFDLAFLGADLYVAGGVDGLFRLSLAPIPQVAGSSRQIRYATSVKAENGVLWVGDRARKAIIKVTP
ncbi:MAG: hypothetical protein M3Y64_02120 [Gemmatimonadota bacterium]|nr:hypothetical protein [Gemmatimonadota bacterium]